MAVILPCSVQNIITIGQLKWMIWMNEFSCNLSLRLGLERYPTLQPSLSSLSRKWYQSSSFGDSNGILNPTITHRPVKSRYLSHAVKLNLIGHSFPEAQPAATRGHSDADHVFVHMLIVTGSWWSYFNIHRIMIDRLEILVSLDRRWRTTSIGMCLLASMVQDDIIQRN